MANKRSKAKKRPAAQRSPASRAAGGSGAPGKPGKPGKPGNRDRHPSAAPAHAAGSPQATTRAPAQARPAKPTRTERLEAARRARRRKSRLVRAGAGGAVALVVGIVAVVVAADRRAERAERERLTAGSCTFDTRNDTLSAAPNNHVSPAGYEVDPPSGGNHAPRAAPAGFYEGGGAPPDPQLVHSLEHGYVVLWHRPGLDEKDMAAIRGVYDRYSRDVLVVPRPSLKVKVAATAWGKRLLCPRVEAGRLAEFVGFYRNEGPEKEEHP